MEVRHPNPVEERKSRGVLADEPIEVAAHHERGPAFADRRVAGVREITGFEAAAAGFARMRDARLEGPAPQLHVCVELLLDLRPTFRIVEAFVDAQRELAPLVRRHVIAAYRP